MPECDFHFTLGEPGNLTRTAQGNLYKYGFLPYDPHLEKYQAAIIHGGTGITYACIQHAVPMLVWPHDYYQHDHAARIIDRGIGLKLRPTSHQVAADLRRLLSDEALHSRMKAFQTLSESYDAVNSVYHKIACLNVLP